LKLLLPGWPRASVNTYLGFCQENFDGNVSGNFVVPFAGAQLRSLEESIQVDR